LTIPPIDESQGDFPPSSIAPIGEEGKSIGKISGPMDDIVFLVLYPYFDFFEFAIDEIVFWIVVQEIIVFRGIQGLLEGVSRITRAQH
jgi:hypothetical protein